MIDKLVAGFKKRNVVIVVIDVNISNTSRLE